MQRAQMLDYLARRLVSPSQQIAQQTQQLAQLSHRLNLSIHQQLQAQQNNLKQIEQNLHHLNPQAVLTRGYAFAQTKDGQIINNSAQINAGDAIHLTFGVGEAQAVVSKTA
jgi:exodeoxyribonuclease VII large subunit